MNNRLVRSRSDRLVAGICAGLGHYLGIDPTFVRIFFILFAITGGFGPLVYLLLWVVIPDEAAVQANPGSQSAEFRQRAGQMRDEFIQNVSHPNPNAIRWFGVALVGAGALLLLENLNLPWFGWFSHNLIWPVLLIVAGAALAFRALRSDKNG